MSIIFFTRESNLTTIIYATYCDFRKNKTSLRHLRVLDRDVELVEQFKYLGMTINNQVIWKAHSTWDPSICVAICWRFSTSLSWFAPSFPLWSAGEAASLNKLLSITDNQDHLLHHTLDRLRSIFFKRMRQLCCLKDSFRRFLQLRVPR